MSDLNKEFSRILTEIENTISNEEERKLVKQKVEELSTLFINKIEYMNEVFDNRIKNVEDNEKRLDIMLKQLQKSVNEIESDIYDEDTDGEFDFEIVCPYCNTEFVTDLSMMNQESNEIKCPECNNIIELDWNDEDDGCSGHCGGCHGCGSHEFDEDEDEDK